MNRILAAIYAGMGGVPLVAFAALSRHEAIIVLGANFIVGLGLASYLGLKPPEPPAIPAPAVEGE